MKIRQKITPFLWFDSSAEEAMEYYTSIFKNSRIVSVRRYPQANLEGPMEGMEGKVLTGVFELEGQQFMALDGGPYFKFTEAMSLFVECESQEEVDYLWEKLADGGASEAQQCGWLKDRFGVSWQIIPARLMEMLEDPERGRPVMDAVLKMKKIEIDVLERAYAGNGESIDASSS